MPTVLWLANLEVEAGEANRLPYGAVTSLKHGENSCGCNFLSSH